MRLSRTNVSNSSGRDVERRDAGDEDRQGAYAAGATDGDLVQLPEWQRAFVLGPNVRFTRTPESAYAKRQTAQGAVEAHTPVSADDMRPQVEEAAIESEPVAIPIPQHQDVSQASVDVTSGETADNTPLSLYLRLKREMNAASRAALQQAAPPPAPRRETNSAAVSRLAAGNPATTPRSLQPTVPVAHASQAAWPEARALDLPVSDFIFWETMPFAAAPAPLPPARRKPVPAFEAEPGSVTAFYREVDCGQPAPHPLPYPNKDRTPPGAVAHDRAIALAQTAAETFLREPAARPLPMAAAKPPAPIARATAVTEARPAAAEVVQAAPVLAATPVRERAPVVTAEVEYEFPPVALLQMPAGQTTHTMTAEALEQSAGLLESILEDFGVKGEIIDVRPGPVVTLYEFEPAPGVKSSRVIGLSDDIARSMSALSARVAVVPGRNVIGIELPNAVRETVFFRELIECESYWETKFKLAVCLGKTIGGEPVIAELAKMPHLLVAGTTGSGKSVAINTFILSLLYRLRPEECRLIMVDPKMLELSVYDGIPHLLTPVVTDPKKAVMALKWAVREMEDRYRKMSRLGVRNIDGFNARAASARAKGETVMCDIQKGFDRSTGEPFYEQEEMDLTPMPYIVVIVDEMADLMMVAGKEIEGAIQRLAQMARAAGIHLIMATQRPSVDVITGTIKANFPTRISFQVTSKIDSRTILGEQGAEHLLGQGDMLHMVGGGRISRVHGPFVSDEEVEAVVAHLKAQGRPEYLGTVTEDADEEDAEEAEDTAVFDKSSMGEEEGDDLYDKAVKVVMRDKKCSTSYIQRRLSVGYNRAASLVERMEKEGLVGPANHVGKREILSGNRDRDPVEAAFGDED
ncbi:DNA translocase FtsK [Rhizobium sp. TRM95111]|uniref:DNA translocase FtsK n=1 Tax=Rhizobium alarense TaxID=2846851 RepID=UPI001F1BA3E2|nr:DNA translocase FtsK [Rhizobium alarense]MCF3641082.1 DNA translocase FtsK [Rhizobium alarense]